MASNIIIVALNLMTSDMAVITPSTGLSWLTAPLDMDVSIDCVVRLFFSSALPALSSDLLPRILIPGKVGRDAT